MKKFFFFFLILFNTNYTAEEIGSRLEQKLKSLHSLKAKFEHIYYSSTISTPLRERGDFFFKKPHLMKWEYKEPEKRIYLLDGHYFLEYLPEEKQLTKFNLLKQEYPSQIISLLSGESEITSEYKIELSPLPTENREAFQIRLIQREDPDSFILLEIDKKSWLIKRAIFFDWEGNKSEFKFSLIQVNINLSEDVFKLELPPDVEVIED